MTSTNSPLAYKYFILGKNSNYEGDYPTAIKWLKQAIEIDSNFTWAMRFISTGYLSMGLMEEGKKWCLRIYKKRDMMSLEEKLYTDYLYAQFFETPYEAIKYLKQLQEIDNQSPPVYRNLGGCYARLNQYEKAISEYEKALEIYRKWDSKPLTVNYFTDLGNAYHITGQYKKEKKLYKKAEQDFPDNILITRRRAVLSLTEGDTVAANQYIEKLISYWKGNSASDVSIATNLARIYSLAGMPDKVEEYYQKVLLLQPENLGMMYNLANFLIIYDRDINKGLELADTLLKLRPENYNYLYTKGLGLYKQGKYKEALEILQTSWDLRIKNAIYDHEAFLHLEAAKKAVTSQKNN
jgi:tetratricopeptide (TPR) repeat protein